MGSGPDVAFGDVDVRDHECRARVSGCDPRTPIEARGTSNPFRRRRARSGYFVTRPDDVDDVDLAGLGPHANRDGPAVACPHQRLARARRLRAARRGKRGLEGAGEQIGHRRRCELAVVRARWGRARAPALPRSSGRTGPPPGAGPGPRDPCRARAGWRRRPPAAWAPCGVGSTKKSSSCVAAPARSRPRSPGPRRAARPPATEGGASRRAPQVAGSSSAATAASITSLTCFRRVGLEVERGRGAPRVRQQGQRLDVALVLVEEDQRASARHRRAGRRAGRPRTRARATRDDFAASNQASSSLSKAARTSSAHTPCGCRAR